MAEREPPATPAPAPTSDDDVRDALPADLDASGYVGPYKFPDNSRRRVPAVIYLVIAAGCFGLWIVRRAHHPVLVNNGFLGAAILLALAGVYGLTSGWRMTVDERGALVKATQTVAFPVGHASAQLAWRGLRSRPTWRILCYSTEDPPRRRGFVLVDAVDGHVVEHVVEDNPEQDWEAP